MFMEAAYKKQKISDKNYRMFLNQESQGKSKADLMKRPSNEGTRKNSLMNIKKGICPIKFLGTLRWL